MGVRIYLLSYVLNRLETCLAEDPFGGLLMAPCFNGGPCTAIRSKARPLPSKVDYIYEHEKPDHHGASVYLTTICRLRELIPAGFAERLAKRTLSVSSPAPDVSDFMTRDESQQDGLLTLNLRIAASFGEPC